MMNEIQLSDSSRSVREAVKLSYKCVCDVKKSYRCMSHNWTRAEPLTASVYSAETKNYK